MLPVEVVPIRVFVRPDSVTVAPGEGLLLKAEILDAHDEGLEWSTDGKGAEIILDPDDPCACG